MSKTEAPSQPGSPPPAPRIYDSPSQFAFDRNARGLWRKLLVITNGGMGDAVAAEPAIRELMRIYPERTIYLSTPYPYLFTHLLKSNAKLYDGPGNLDLSNWWPFFVHVGNEHMLGEYYSTIFSHPVHHTFISIHHRTPNPSEMIIRLPEGEATEELKGIVAHKRTVFLHFGKTWDSKAIPAFWINELISEFKKREIFPVLFGQKDRIVPDIDMTYCQSLVDKTKPEELIWLCRNAKYILSNDSAAIHIAASDGGEAHIGIISSVKDPEHLSHWRYNGYTNEYQFGFNTAHFNKDFTARHMWRPCDEPLPDQPWRGNANMFPPGVTWNTILPTAESVAQYYEEKMQQDEK